MGLQGVTTSAQRCQRFPWLSCEVGRRLCSNPILPFDSHIFHFSKCDLHTMQNSGHGSTLSFHWLGVHHQGRQAGNSVFTCMFMTAPHHRHPIPPCSDGASPRSLHRLWILQQAGDLSKDHLHPPALSIRNAHGYKIFPPSRLRHRRGSQDG